MQKPDSETLRQAVIDFGNRELGIIPTEDRARIEEQVFRMMNDLSEEHWAEKPEVDLIVICAFCTMQVVQFILQAKQLQQMLDMAGVEYNDRIGKLPYEVFPDRNFYEVIDEVTAQAKARGLDPASVQIRYSEQRSSTNSDDLENIDFSRGFTGFQA